MDEFIGIIKLFAGNFAPRGWAFCDGSLLSVAQNTALFSILGTTYGGNGTTTFALPDLRSRAAIGKGQGPGLQAYPLADKGGVESVILTTLQMPMHTHTLNASTAPGAVEVPTSEAVLAVATGATGTGEGVTVSSYVNGNANTALNPTAIGMVGGSQPHENRSPYLALNYIICVEGIFPPRS